MSWDEYFHELCKAVGKNTKCRSRQIGAILVRDKSIVSTGYNGPPRGVMTCQDRCLNDGSLMDCLIENGVDPQAAFESGKCPRQIIGFKSGEGLEWCVAGHAERNCLINAARNGIETRDTIMYMDCGIPCSPCLVEILNAGVKAIVVTKVEYYDVSAEYLMMSSNLKFRVFGDRQFRNYQGTTFTERSIPQWHRVNEQPLTK